MNDLEHVNAGATDLDRHLTIRILVLTQGLPEDVAAKARRIDTVREMGEEYKLPNGSFTLCQLVRRLRKANCFWHAFEAGYSGGQWFWHEEWEDEMGRKNRRLHRLVKDVNAHDLTGAAKAYVAYLEIQKQKEEEQ